MNTKESRIELLKELINRITKPSQLGRDPSRTGGLYDRYFVNMGQDQVMVIDYGQFRIVYVNRYAIATERLGQVTLKEFECLEVDLVKKSIEYLSQRYRLEEVATSINQQDSRIACIAELS